MKRLRSPLYRSIFLHLILLVLVSGIALWHHSEPVMDASITLDDIFHKAIHKIGIPHQEPVHRIKPQEESLKPSPDSSNQSKSELQESVEPSEPGGGIAASELQKYFQDIVRRIHQVKKYPKDARFNEQEGVVQVLLEISPGGDLVRIQLEKECPFKSLNDAAFHAIQSLGKLDPLPLKPDGTPASRSIMLHIPIHFQLK